MSPKRSGRVDLPGSLGQFSVRDGIAVPDDDAKDHRESQHDQTGAHRRNRYEKVQQPAKHRKNKRKYERSDEKETVGYRQSDAVDERPTRRAEPATDSRERRLISIESGYSIAFDRDAFNS